MSVAENVQEAPQTPEREATIVEELEEEKLGAAPELFNEPEIEEAAAPLANGAHKDNITEARGQPAATGALPEDETW